MKLASRSSAIEIFFFYWYALIPLLCFFSSIPITCPIEFSCSSGLRIGLILCFLSFSLNTVFLVSSFLDFPLYFSKKLHYTSLDLTFRVFFIKDHISISGGLLLPLDLLLVPSSKFHLPTLNLRLSWINYNHLLLFIFFIGTLFCHFLFLWIVLFFLYEKHHRNIFNVVNLTVCFYFFLIVIVSYFHL